MRLLKYPHVVAVISVQISLSNNTSLLSSVVYGTRAVISRSLAQKLMPPHPRGVNLLR
jgi:hypothetical protein